MPTGVYIRTEYYRKNRMVGNNINKTYWGRYTHPDKPPHKPRVS